MIDLGPSEKRKTMKAVLAQESAILIRSEYLAFHRPDITDDEILETVDAIKSGWITTGPKTKAFERRFAEYVGASHAIAVDSHGDIYVGEVAMTHSGIDRGSRVIQKFARRR